ncbi:xylose isomerase [Leptospira perolatii]|uniref:Xylose isomerase n=2 Tax=Leptospira perolatii TaxID=2023191 RepID=A0A2M9ZLS7_9LEPT|nr:xylose isomerase [Leptospira perolatii]PJZ72934.1 xylose isomerase [Leptospira perolatii]
MQGRLLPKYQGRFQAHPIGYWQEEFYKAAGYDLDCIEFILDYNDFEINPLMSSAGLDTILELINETGVSVYTVCADYFMEAPLHHADEAVSRHSQKILKDLLNRGKILGLTDIVIPCVDQSSIKDKEAQDRFYENLMSLVNLAELCNINLSLETDLPPEPFAELVNRFDSNFVTVNYDTGNSASLGYDPEEEFKCYGNKISDIHLKDRLLGGGSVMFGTGATEFTKIFNLLGKMNYSGPFVMQSYRDDEGLQVFESQLNWIRNFFLRDPK